MLGLLRHCKSFEILMIRGISDGLFCDDARFGAMRRAECMGEERVGAVRPKAGRTIIGVGMERKDRLFLVVLDAHILDAGVVLLVDVLEHVCRLLGAVDQLLELRWNRVGEVGGRVIRVVAELAVLGVGIVFLDHGLALRVGDLAGVCRYRNAACVAEEVLHIIGEDVVDVE